MKHKFESLKDRFEHLPNLKSEDVVYGYYNPLLGKPKAKYNLIEDKNVWLAVIFQDTILGKKVVIDTGTEKNRKAIKQWIDLYFRMKAYEKTEEEVAQLVPDMYDRSLKTKH